MTSVAISGVEGALRTRISEALTQIFDEVISFTPDAEDVSLADVGSIIHLAFSDDSDQRHLIGLLDRATEAEISQVIVVSSAMVITLFASLLLAI